MMSVGSGKSADVVRHRIPWPETVRKDLRRASCAGVGGWRVDRWPGSWRSEPLFVDGVGSE